MAASEKNKTGWGGKKKKMPACEKTAVGRATQGSCQVYRAKEKLRCAAPLMREERRERMMCVRNISDIQIHNSGY